MSNHTRKRIVPASQLRCWSCGFNGTDTDWHVRKFSWFCPKCRTEGDRRQRMRVHKVEEQDADTGEWHEIVVDVNGFTWSGNGLAQFVRRRNTLPPGRIIRMNHPSPPSSPEQNSNGV